jgi:hypothetical protein
VLVSGVGEHHYSSGDKYIGKFVKDRPHGNGTYHYSNGDQYKGLWFNGKKEGQGIMLWHDCTMYKGRWKNDKMNDTKGRLYFECRLVKKGVWIDDTFIEGIVYSKDLKHILIGRFNGDVFTGSVYKKDESIDGKGVNMGDSQSGYSVFY